MPGRNSARWIRVGLLAVPLYGLLTFWATLTHQPDPDTDFAAYARYVTTTGYLVGHLVGSIGGTMLAIFGAVAPGAYLANGRTGRLAMIAMVASVAGHALILTVFGMSTFATPAVGEAYLAGQRDVVGVNEAILGVPLVVTALSGGLLYSTGAVLFGVAVWRSGVLPRWAGALYAPTGFLISILGLMVGASQTLGSLLLVAGSGWIALYALRRPETSPVGVTARPREQ